MQFLYAAKKFSFGNASLLFFKDDFSKYHFAVSDLQKKTPIYDRGSWSRYTVGGNIFGTHQKIAYSASAYYQGGNYRDGTALNEYFLSV